MADLGLSTKVGLCPSPPPPNADYRVKIFLTAVPNNQVPGSTVSGGPVASLAIDE